MTLQDAFSIVVVVFTVTNLAAMGLELNLREALKTLRSAQAISLAALVAKVAARVFARQVPTN